MCLTGKKYFVHLHSSQGTPLAGAPNAKAEMRYSSVRLNDILRDEDHSIEYFRVKVEFFSMYLPLGSQQTAVAIHCPQVRCPYHSSNLGNTHVPLAFARPSEVSDVDLTADESLKAVCYGLSSADSAGRVCTIQRDAFLDIKLSNGRFRELPYFEVGDGVIVPNTIRAAVPDYTLVLSIEPIATPTKKSSACRS